MIMLALLATILISGCVPTSSSVVVVPSCPPLAGYTQEQREDVARKREANPHEAWAQMIHDYDVLRKNVREMCGLTKRI